MSAPAQRRAAWLAAASACIVALAILAAPSPGHASAGWAPPGATGPKLRDLGHRAAELRASLTCSGNLRKAERAPVLLLSGTTVDPVENFAWNWIPALEGAGFPWCYSTAPEEDNMDDVQARGEYIVYAIRRMHRRSGRRIAIYGHSQGGMVGRWALRFWRNTRKMVSDVVGAAPSNRGTDSALAICTLRCPASFWQQRTGAEFIAALNSVRETHRRVSYTNVYTRYDLVVFPNADETGRSSLDGPGRVANVAVQDVCPLNLADHLTVGTVDPVTWELFLDAVSHPGPADPARVGSSVCGEAFMPGVDRRRVATDLAAAGAALATTTATHPPVDAEPPLRGYAHRGRG